MIDVALLFYNRGEADTNTTIMKPFATLFGFALDPVVVLTSWRCDTFTSVVQGTLRWIVIILFFLLSAV